MLYQFDATAFYQRSVNQHVYMIGLEIVEYLAVVRDDQNPHLRRFEFCNAFKYGLCRVDIQPRIRFVQNSELRLQHGELEDFSKFYEGWKILFSSVAGNVEDEKTTKLLQQTAEDAGFKTRFAYVDEVEFNDEEGVFFDGENYEYWFKLIPWETIAIEEGELALILKNIVQNQKAIILNPAYTLLFQSKGIMKILWDLYPNHPLLLQSSFSPIIGKKMIKKPFLAREGANVAIFDADGKKIEENGGDYGANRAIYQEFYEFNKDVTGNSYQAGVFFAYEACALGYRRGGEILDNYSKFVGHFIK